MPFGDRPSGEAQSGDYFTGWNFAGQNLTNARFPGALLDYTHFTGADTRGAQYLELPTTSVTTNLIRPNGYIAGLDLTAGKLLVVRDYDGNGTASPPTGPLPIIIDQHVAMDATGTLRLVFDADPWNSTISFAPGITVALGGGMLDLRFAAGLISLRRPAIPSSSSIGPA